MNQCVGIILDAIYQAESCQVKCSTHSTIYGPAPLFAVGSACDDPRPSYTHIYR